MIWIRIRMLDPADMSAYRRLFRRLTEFTRQQRLNVVFSPMRIGLCQPEPSLQLADELILINWLGMQPELVRPRRRWLG